MILVWRKQALNVPTPESSVNGSSYGNWLWPLSFRKIWGYQICNFQYLQTEERPKKKMLWGTPYMERVVKGCLIKTRNKQTKKALTDHLLQGQ